MHNRDISMVEKRRYAIQCTVITSVPVDAENASGSFSVANPLGQKIHTASR